jgi:hypothetical protein
MFCDFKGNKCMLTARARNVFFISPTFYDLRNSLAAAMNHCKKTMPGAVTSAA